MVVCGREVLLPWCVDLSGSFDLVLVDRMEEPYLPRLVYSQNTTAQFFLYTKVPNIILPIYAVIFTSTLWTAIWCRPEYLEISMRPNSFFFLNRKV